MTEEETRRLVEEAVRQAEIREREWPLLLQLDKINDEIRHIELGLRYLQYNAKQKRNKEAKARRDAVKLERMGESTPDRVARNLQIYELRKSGESLRGIGNKFAITPERVRQICLRLDEKLSRAKKTAYPRAHLARPIDPGGPRDVWLTFMPGQDSRMDYMEPSDGS